VPVRESPQFQLPFLSARPVADPRGAPDFTLNQFNMVIRHEPTDRDVSQLHFYTYNPAFEDALPKPLRSAGGAPLRKQLLQRVCVALGYLPSWAAPEFAMSVRPPADEGSLPELVLEATDAGSPFKNPMLRQVARRVTAAAPLLDLWPVLPALRMSAGGKSYHWGGVFPHGESGSRLSSDPLGRVAPWRRIHLVDSAVLPTVPATTFALTVMANAHRIVDSTVKELD
jgi:choline dehydrogenase-like flavoprotein